MVKAYVLVTTEGRDVNKIAKEMTDIEEVENVNLIYGEYDIIALVQSQSLINLKDLALEKIGKIQGVIKTSTLIIADAE